MATDKYYCLVHPGLDNYTNYRKELCDQQQQGVVRASDRDRRLAPEFFYR